MRPAPRWLSDVDRHHAWAFSFWISRMDVRRSTTDGVDHADQTPPPDLTLRAFAQKFLPIPHSQPTETVDGKLTAIQLARRVPAHVDLGRGTSARRGLMRLAAFFNLPRTEAERPAAKSAFARRDFYENNPPPIARPIRGGVRAAPGRPWCLLAPARNLAAGLALFGAIA